MTARDQDRRQRGLCTSCGVCPVCGSPWRRVVEKKPSSSDRKNWSGAQEQLSRNGRSRPGGFYDGEVLATDWQSGCRCSRADTRPALVLDPFCGSGTTGLVARGLGRRFLGVELKQDYCVMARKRIGNEMPLFDSVS